MKILGLQLALVFSYPLRLAQNALCHRLFYFLLACTRFEVKLVAERVESIKISMRFARRRAGAVVADLAEVIAPLPFTSR